MNWIVWRLIENETIIFTTHALRTYDGRPPFDQVRSARRLRAATNHVSGGGRFFSPSKDLYIYLTFCWRKPHETPPSSRSRHRDDSDSSYGASGKIWGWSRAGKVRPRRHPGSVRKTVSTARLKRTTGAVVLNIGVGKQNALFYKRFSL